MRHAFSIAWDRESAPLTPALFKGQVVSPHLHSLFQGGYDNSLNPVLKSLPMTQ